jgi:hypothetical protein
MVQAAGIRLDLTAPPPVAPARSLLSMPGVVQDDAGRWLNGVALDAYPCDPPALWEPCSEGTFRDKAEGGTIPIPVFDAFVVYLPITCSTFGYIGLQEKVERSFEAKLSYGVEQGLIAGVEGSTNPYVADTNLDVVGSGETPSVALAYLEREIGQTGSGGMILAPPNIVSRLDAIYEGPGPLRTSAGTPIAVTSGSIGVVPDGEPALTATEDYMFAVGPVEVRLGPLVSQPLAEALDRSDNVLTYRAERYVLATWDTCLQAGVLVDWAT